MSASLQMRIGYPFTALFTVNLRRFVFSKTVVAPFIIFGLPVLVMFIWRLFTVISEPAPGAPISDPYIAYTQTTAYLFSVIIIPLIALMLGSPLLSEEWQTGTMLLLQIRPVPRWVISAGKLFAYSCFTVLMMTVSITVSFLLAASLPDSGMIPYDLDVLFRDWRIYSLGLIVYGAVMMLIGIYFKRPIMFGIAFLIWDLFASYLPGYAHKLTARYYLQSIMPGQGDSNIMLNTFAVHSPASVTEAVLVLVGIIIVCIFLSAFVLSRKTIQPVEN